MERVKRKHSVLGRLLLIAGLCAIWLLHTGCEGCAPDLEGIFGPGSDFTPPRISFEYPQPDDIIAHWQAVLRLKASDTPNYQPLGGEKVSGMDRVELLVQDVVVAALDSFPFDRITWNTRDFEDGEYTLIARAFDRAGHSATDTVEIQLAHTLVISEIEVTDVKDQGSADNPLEVEIHLFEQSTNRFLGCAGRSSGLQSVRRSDSLYHVSAYFRTSRAPVVFSDIAAHEVFLAGFEDDLDPCPDPPRTSGFIRDDSLGVSQPFSAATLESEPLLRFGRVAHLKLGKNRVTRSK
jgi:hypothetical protein